ncbi:hypothetical protein [Runella sp. SP2]|uniref:hypothetical protein n=1 Tax=Runella sp. SP2 TaxID=2268026 RepID=UPI000F080D1C|nr:hypothetical protein [Runella sp. SP2]AYQ32326.1 hypothetical protein DTQ70_09100 [Runella sp. SP2]
MSKILGFQIFDPQLLLIAIKLEHLRKMEELAIRKIEAENERRRLDLVIINDSLSHDIEFQKRFTNRFNELITEFTESCQKSTWQLDELKEFVSMALMLKMKVESYCNYRYIVPQTLQLYHNLQKLIDYGQGRLTKVGVNQELITFDLTDKARKKWENMKVPCFEAAFIDSKVIPYEILENQFNL